MNVWCKNQNSKPELAVHFIWEACLYIPELLDHVLCEAINYKPSLIVKLLMGNLSTCIYHTRLVPTNQALL